MKTELPQWSKLSQYLAHCVRERTYFILFKKCVSSDCNICLPPWLTSQGFQSLNHLPDPMPYADNPKLTVPKLMSQQCHHWKQQRIEEQKSIQCSKTTCCKYEFVAWMCRMQQAQISFFCKEIISHRKEGIYMHCVWYAIYLWSNITRIHKSKCWKQ